MASPTWSKLKDRILGPRLQSPLVDVCEAWNVEVRSCIWIPRLGGLLSGFHQSAAAVALHSWILISPSVRVTRPLLRHELQHILQWRRDRFFLLRYCYYHLRYGYRNNPYEREAVESERLPLEKPGEPSV